MKKLINYFLQGLLYIAPLGITAYVIYYAFNFLDNLLQDLLLKFFDIQINFALNVVKFGVIDLVFSFK